MIYKKNSIIGKSVQGKSLEIFSFSSSENALPKILLIGGVHGEEIEGVWLTEKCCEKFSSAFNFKNFELVILKNANPDGIEKRVRQNSNGVDLNRNLPTKDWTKEVSNPRYFPGKNALSEPETIALVNYLEQSKPVAILSAHSFSKVQLNINGAMHGSEVREWAEKMATICHYPITEDIGYPTPGCLGTYAGFERKIPTITLEIESGMEKDKVEKLFLETIETGLQYWENKL